MIILTSSINWGILVTILLLAYRNKDSGEGYRFGKFIKSTFYNECKTSKEVLQQSLKLLAVIICVSYCLLLFLIVFSIVLMILMFPLMLLFAPDELSGMDISGLGEMLYPFVVIGNYILPILIIPFFVVTLMKYMSLVYELLKDKETKKRAIKKIKKINKNIKKDIDTLKDLRNKLKNRNQTYSVYNLCELLYRISPNNSQINEFSILAKEQVEILKDIEVYEKKIILLAKQYESLDDKKTATYYFNIAKG